MVPVFDETWAVDTEFRAREGERVMPICLVARALASGVTHRRWLLGEPPGAPPWAPNDLVVCYSAPAECGVFDALGWAQPRFLVDLWAEYRVNTNGVTMATGLLDALQAYGIPTVAGHAAMKNVYREMCVNGTAAQLEANRAGILAYCEQDVLPLADLFRAMAPSLNWEHALLRGEYGACCAEIEHRGIPVDAARVHEMAERWPEVRRAAAEIASVRMRFRIYGGETGTQFSYARFGEYLNRVGLLEGWPLTNVGQLATDDPTLKTWSARHPDLEPFRHARRTLSMLHPARLHVGRDGRCRTQIRPFAALTGRNQPRAHTPLAYPGWMRALITPPPGRALVILDYSQQEFALAGVLSGDERMLRAYVAGDAYLAGAIECGSLPAGARRGEPGVDAVRDVFKVSALAIAYGVAPRGLAGILGIGESRAAAIVRRHRGTFRTYWEWSNQIAATAAFDGELVTPHGWRVDTRRIGDRTARNFLIQGTGGDILRLATVKARRAGVEAVALVHDAIVAEAGARDVLDVARALHRAMVDAGEEVAGVSLRVDAQVVGPGERYLKDEKARSWWTAVWKRLGRRP